MVTRVFLSALLKMLFFESKLFNNHKIQTDIVLSKKNVKPVVLKRSFQSQSHFSQNVCWTSWKLLSKSMFCNHCFHISASRNYVFVHQCFSKCSKSTFFPHWFCTSTWNQLFIRQYFDIHDFFTRVSQYVYIIFTNLIFTSTFWQSLLYFEYFLKKALRKPTFWHSRFVYSVSQNVCRTSSRFHCFFISASWNQLFERQHFDNHCIFTNVSQNV